MKRLLLALLLAGALLSGGLLLKTLPPGASAAARREPAAAGGRPTAAERHAIEATLATLPEGTREAADEDGRDSDSRREMESVYADYHPFFVRGDLNGDGALDFAQAFVRRGGGQLWFDVAAYFGGPEGFSEPVWVERAVSLADGDLAIERSIVVVTPDLSREETRRWRWEPGENRFVDADAVPSAEPEDEDAPDETPDEKPRVRV